VRVAVCSDVLGIGRRSGREAVLVSHSFERRCQPENGPVRL
jgi:hypothetical protein